MAGISKHQLREWTGRRGIVPADVPGRGRGRHALYSWSTVLVLRIVAELRTRFHMEVGCYSTLLTRLRDDLGKYAPLGLHGRILILSSPDEYRLVAARPAFLPGTALIIDLENHITAIADSIGSDGSNQLPLFPAVSL